MPPRGSRTTFWVGAYLLLVLGPLAMLSFSALPSRGFWVEFCAALGFVALAMFALQFVLTARFKRIASPYGLDTILQFHREAGLVAVGFASAHPIVMVVAVPADIAFLDPRVMFWRAVMLIAAIIAMLLVVLLALKRRALKIPYEWWRLSHGLLGVVIVIIAIVHVLEVNWYVAGKWQRSIWVGSTAAALLLLGHVRVIKPLMMKRTPYRVVDRRREGFRTWTLVLEPVGHSGMHFKPGQFAWLTLGPSPFSMQQHPFSVSSSAIHPDRLEFTIRELGDFTSTIGDIKIGSSAFVEGPYGAFVPDLTSSRGLVLIAGGVGIAPVMSIVRTLNDMKDRRPVILIYGSASRERTVFAEELLALQKSLRLRVTFVLEDPDDSLSSESGRISEDVVDRHIQTNDEFDYFICGPAPMMDLVERHLRRAGVPSELIHSERFDIG